MTTPSPRSIRPCHHYSKTLPKTMENEDFTIDAHGKGPLNHDGDNAPIHDEEEDMALLEGELDTLPLTHAASIVDPDELPSTPSFRLVDILHRNLLPDAGVVVAGFPLVEGEFTVKLLKFILLTFGSIALVHEMVKNFTDDRDRAMTLSTIWRYDTNLIVMDCVVYFLVGRMWRQRGIDHMAWIIPIAICNIYFECQTYFTWIRHSVSLFEIHCLWPWQLWIFVSILIPAICGIAFAHVYRAWRTRVLLVKLVEISMGLFFFLAPVMTSNYFHLHHWFAGWLLGMHANFDVWWSRVAMAYCWGMYINGIAVYGRDPVLTCEYAYFLTIDNRCPYINCYLEALEDMAQHPQNATHVVEEMDPVDWRNCSATGYHP